MTSTRRTFAALCLGLLVIGTPACSYGRGNASFAPGATPKVSFQFFRDSRIFLPVQVNGHPIEAMLDSGAGITTMDAAYAAQLGVKTGASIPMRGATGTIQGQIVTGVSLTVGAMRLENLRVAVIDLSQIAAGIGRPLPLVLGRDAFDAAIVDIDFRARRIAFHDPDAFTPPAGAVRVPLKPAHSGVRSVEVAVEGAKAEAADLDLGNSTPLLVSLDYAARNRLLEGRAKAEVSAGGVGGRTAHDIAVLKSVRFGGAEVKDVPALFNRSGAELPTSGLNIGMPVLSRFHLFFDYGRDALFLIADPDAIKAPFRKDRAGLGTTLNGDSLSVIFVSPGGPADRAGWKAGDRIAAVNGEAVGPNFYAGPHAAWASGPAGRAVDLTLADGSKRRLVLKDYF